MIIGIVKEIKAEENRVSMTPEGVEAMKYYGHSTMSSPATIREFVDHCLHECDLAVYA